MYIILGASGHVGGRTADLLLAAGKPVRAIGRSIERLKPLITKGAEYRIGEIEDNVQAVHLRLYQNAISKLIAGALKKAGATRVVNLSSMGAHQPGNTGPIAGLHDHEERLNKIKGLSVVHLRAAYFMENLMSSMDLIRGQGINGSALKGDLAIPVIATRDIGAAAAKLLMDPDFTGQSVRYLLGERDLSMIEMTGILGRAIGKPDLRYVQFSYEETEKAFRLMGFSRDVAHSFVEMARAMNEGIVTERIERTPDSTTVTSFEQFAGEFERMYCVNNPECRVSGF
jgi:uncharacterized protein YbjT (DUF2867 family)